jgi:hypothetical protein
MQNCTDEMTVRNDASQFNFRAKPGQWFASRPCDASTVAAAAAILAAARTGI